MSHHRLSKSQVERYSRQLLVPGFGVSGQQCLVDGSVLIVGAGGLGCPAGLYLASAGVGRIGFVDYDKVELNNLHRQILHKESSVGLSKVDSACSQLAALNSGIKYEPHNVPFTVSNAVQLVSQYDVVIDATDNAVTRYLINDACIMAGKPLISGAALQWEGQLTVYNHANGPCYRCLYPEAPPAATITNCDAGGVIGAVTGVIGSMQALEAIRLLTKAPCHYAGRLYLFDAASGTNRTVKLRGKQSDCMCSNLKNAKLCDNYEVFCGSSATDKTPSVSLLGPNDRMTCQEYSVLHNQKNTLLVDVRPASQFEICNIPDSINIPFKELEAKKELLESLMANKSMVVCVCRRGNQSQHAVKKLQSMGINLPIKDIIGGMRSWSLEVDPNCPIY